MLLCEYAGERLVNVGGTECMCGGTHVKNTADIRSFTATKIKKVHIYTYYVHTLLIEILNGKVEQQLAIELNNEVP